MPNLIDLVEMADSLGSRAVFLATERCVVVRNRHASCQRCSNACPTDAVSAADNVLELNTERCVSCGACTAVCPTEALIPLAPLDADLSGAIDAAIVAMEGQAIFACARIAFRHQGNPEKFVEVPCLARVEESALLGLAAGGVGNILLVDGTCATCRFHACNVGIDATVASANQLLAAQGSGIRIRRATAFPEGALLEDQRALLGASRRGFFTQARSVAKDAAGKTVERVLKKNDSGLIPTLRDRLHLSDAGTLPQFNPMRRRYVLDAMDRLGAAVVREVDTRLFGAVYIDVGKCSSCGMCAVFCPTGALKKSEVAPEGGRGSYLEFSAADCVQCNLCADVCLKKCLKVSSVVQMEELFNFEPRFILLPPKPERTGFLSGLEH